MNNAGPDNEISLLFGEVRQYLEQSLVSTQVIVAKRECFQTTRFNPEMPRLQDYDIVIRLSEKYLFYFVEKQLVNMYVQDDSISASWQKLKIAEKLLFEQYGDYIATNKNMNYNQTRYLAWAKIILAKTQSGNACIALN